MALRTQFENNNEIGAFARLTNSYCLLAHGAGERFYSSFEGELAEPFPVVHTTIAGCRIVGRLTAGNKHGLLVPSSTTDYELEHLKSSLPDSVKIQLVEESLSALGNVIACNDHVALVHPDLEKETEEAITDVLNVEVIRQTVANHSLAGSYCVLNNTGGLVHPKTSLDEQDELSSLLQVPVVAGTVNRGSGVIGGGIVVNDFTAISGMSTTGAELRVIDQIFQGLEHYKGSPIAPSNAPNNSSIPLSIQLLEVQYRDINSDDYELLQHLDDSVDPKIVPPSTLKEFPTEVVTDQDMMCSICKDEYKVEQVRKYLPCKHSFHAECIDEWLGKVSVRCPLDGQSVL